MKYTYANKYILFILIALFGAAADASAAIRTVTKLADTNDGACTADCSLREAIAVSVSGDKIVFQPGLAGPMNINLNFGSLVIDKNITLTGTDTVSITGGAQGQTRVFVIKGGAVVTMNNVEIKNGEVGGLEPMPYYGIGAGIYVDASTLNLNDSYIHHNEAMVGGGVHVRNGVLKIKNTEFSYNKSESHGAAVTAVASTLDINGSVFWQNQSRLGSGAAIHATECDTTIRRTIFASNSANNAGSYDWGNGGALNLVGGTAYTTRIRDTSFYGNTATVGGAIANKTKLYLINSTVSNNAATQSGGGLHSDGRAIIRTSTITQNSSPAFGAALDVVPQSIMYLSNNIIAGNTGANEIRGKVNSFGFNIFGSTAGANIVAPYGGDKLNVNPLLGPLSYNGGPTPTHVPQPGSPAIDAGSNGLAVDWNADPLAVDQRGYARVSNTTIDIGAVEIPQRAWMPVSLAGRITDATGATARGAEVIVTDLATGEKLTAKVKAGGFYRLDKVRQGQTLLIEVAHERLSFAPQTVTVTDETTPVSLAANAEN